LQKNYETKYFKGLFLSARRVRIEKRNRQAGINLKPEHPLGDVCLRDSCLVKQGADV